MFKLSVKASDEEGVAEAVGAARDYKDKLWERKTAKKRDGIYLTRGNVFQVRDMLVWGTRDNVKVEVGPAYETPEWMKE
jgi:hypothetical protein